jgi:hypothetical protein
MKHSLLVRFLVLFAASTLLVIIGCGYDNGLKLARVSGKVTFKGEPVKNGTVFFMPDEGKGTIGPSAVGSIRDDGTYVASTDYAGDGVIVGSHKIGLTGLEPVSAAIDPEKEPAGPLPKAKTARSRGDRKKDVDLFTDSGGRKYRYLMPKKLSNPGESGISVKVERGSNTLNFDIAEDGQVRINP